MRQAQRWLDTVFVVDGVARNELPTLSDEPAEFLRGLRQLLGDHERNGTTDIANRLIELQRHDAIRLLDPQPNAMVRHLIVELSEKKRPETATVNAVREWLEGARITER